MGVGMELFRMFVYLSFPAGLFYIANKPEWYERNVTALLDREERMSRSPTREQIEERLKQLKMARAKQDAQK